MNKNPGDSEFVELAFTPDEVVEASSPESDETCAFLGAQLPPDSSEQPPPRS